MNRETNNFVSIVGLFVIVAIMMAPVDQKRVSKDIQKMGPGVAAHFEDCPKIRYQVRQAGGTIPYVVNRAKQTQDWQKMHYANGGSTRNDWHSRHEAHQRGR